MDSIVTAGRVLRTRGSLVETRGQSDAERLAIGERRSSRRDEWLALIRRRSNCAVP
jgi:hypothetical protein